MKKHLILFFFISTFTLISCSKDDETVNNNNDKILGTWVLLNVNPQNEFFSADDCSQASTITLNEDYSASGTFYMSSENCEPQSSEGDWQNLGESRYQLTVPVFGNVEGTVGFEGSNKFTYNAEGFLLTFERQ